jgi:group I intron endonuclease
MVIYITKNLITGKKYVGKDSYNNPDYLGSGSLLLEDIKKYGKENFKKDILEYCTKDNLGEREEYWIQILDASKSKDFYNIRNQTSGWYNKDLNPEKYKYVVDKISKSHKGKKLSQETKDKISNNQPRKEKLSKANKNKPKPIGFGDKISSIKKGKSLSKDHCNRISQSKIGKKQSLQHIENRSKPIIQLDKEDNFIKEYKNTQEIININGWKRENINSCLNGRSKTAYGYKFIYK